VFPLKYELDVIFQKTASFIVTAVETSNLTQHNRLSSVAEE
jgi:hypothetical protein